MDNYNDIFDDEGELAIPTMRGSANLDVQDYQDIYGQSSILDDDLEEDVPSTPGRHPGAASATDVEGTSDFDMLDVPGGMDAPGMKQTTYGASPWGPGSSTGYRPYSQQRTDMSLRALGDDADDQEPRRMNHDTMTMEPEVIDAVPVQEVGPWDDQWHGERNQEPSNARIDPMTLYDRTSYEYDESTQNVIGNGIFDMEEGVTWRPRDGSFMHQYALPAYIGTEDELGVQQSEMWDSTAEEWRVTQPSAGGISLARKVPGMKPVYTPFGPQSEMPEMRPEVTGPRSNIEAFGRKAAHCLVVEARMHQPKNRSRFLNSAIEALGPGASRRCRRAADRLIELGRRPDVALEDAMAHCIMHATVKDMTQRNKRNRNALPRLDRMSTAVQKQSQLMQEAAAKHLQPLTSNGTKLREDLGALYRSPAARGMGQVAEETPVPPPSNGDAPGVFRPRNLLIAGGVGVVGYLLFANRKAIAKNIKKVMG